MTSSMVIDETMRRRAEKLANRIKSVPSLEKKMSIAVFEAGAELFGIPTDSLICIVKTPELAPLPRLPAWMKGAAQVRGEIVGVVDLALWFETREPSTAAFTAVVEGSPGKIGFLVDGVREFREVGASDIAETFNNAPADGGRPIHATTRDLTTILDIEKLFNCPEVRVDYRKTEDPTDQQVRRLEPMEGSQ